MGYNTAYLTTLPGVCKIVAIIFLILSISLGGHAYEHSLYNIMYNFLKLLVSQLNDFPQLPDDLPGLGREKFFLAINGMILILSVSSLVCHVINPGIPYDRKARLMDLGYHVLGALFLIIAGSLIIASSRKINKDVCNFPDLTSSPLPSSTTMASVPTMATTTTNWTEPSTEFTSSTTDRSSTEPTTTPHPDIPSTTGSTEGPTSTSQPDTPSTTGITEGPTTTSHPDTPSTTGSTEGPTSTSQPDPDTPSTTGITEGPTTTPYPNTLSTTKSTNGTIENDEEPNSVPNAKPVESNYKGIPALLMLIQDIQSIQKMEACFPRERFSVLADEDFNFSGLKCQYRAEKEVAGAFNILASFIFGFLAVILFLRLNSYPPPSNNFMQDIVL